MSDQDLNFLDAIRIAMEAEKKAAEFYREAAQETRNPLGRMLFEQLSDFEEYHYSQLVDLEESLCNDGTCVLYEGRELSLQVPAEVEQIKEVNQVSVMKIITQAIKIKTQAKKRYAALAEQTSDPSGQDMFRRLAEEENTNLKVLDAAYWSLNDHGVWVWPKQLPEHAAPR